VSMARLFSTSSVNLTVVVDPPNFSVTPLSMTITGKAYRIAVEILVILTRRVNSVSRPFSTRKFES